MLHRSWSLCGVALIGLLLAGCGEKGAEKAPDGEKAVAKADGDKAPEKAPLKAEAEKPANPSECPAAAECKCPEALAAKAPEESGTKDPATEGGTKVAAEPSADAGMNATAELYAKVLALAPQGTLVVGAADLAGLVRSAADLLDVLVNTKLSWEATVKDLTELCQTRLGVNPFELTGVGMVVLKKGPVFMIPWTKPLLLPVGVETRDVDGVKMIRAGGLWMVQEGEWVLAGVKRPVLQQLGVLKGTEPKLSAEDQAIHSNMAKALGASVVLVTADVRMAGALVQGELPGAILDSVGASLGGNGRFSVLLKAPAETRKLILDYLQKSLVEAKTVLEQAYAKRADLEMGEALGVILAWHQFEAISGGFKPQEKGEYLALEISGVTSAVLPLLGVAAAVAVPAFIKYMRKAKTVEAIDMMDRMYKGAANYVSTPRLDAAGAKLPCAFPPSGAIEGKKCCEFPDQKCPADPAVWAGSPWSDLNFQMTDPRFYRYEFKSEGTGTNAKATIVAHGDLDCDGIESTFEMQLTATAATGEPGPGATECVVQRGAFYTEHDAE